MRNPSGEGSQTTLSWAGHTRATLALGMPLIGAQLAQMAIGVTDTVMIGWLGAPELAAAVLGAQAFFLFFIFGTGFTLAVMPLAAQAHGRDDVRGVRRSVRMGMWVVLLYSAIVMVPLWMTESILLALGQPEATAALAGDYMRVAQWAMAPSLMIMTFRSYLSALERAQVVLWATVAGTIANAFLNYMFIFGNFGAPRLEVVGAAVASVGTATVTFVLLTLYTVTRGDLKRYQLLVRFWRPDWQAFFEVQRLGWPISATILAETSLFAASSVMIGWIGTIELAAHGIALQLASIAFMFPLGLSGAATVRVGNAYGRKDWVGLGRAGSVSIALAIAITLSLAAVFWIFPEALIGLYLDESNPDAAAVLRHAVPLLFVAAAFQTVDGLQAIGAGLLRGLKDTKVPMIYAVFSYWAIGMTAAYLLAFCWDLGAVGVWWGLAVGLLLAAILMNWRFMMRERLGLVGAHP
ncbi:MATE family efflux transporter [Hoeflea poritis]|uniref:Multidrug-efflux transporter n=1 Tax=Hoeflea poritis TaxID=2993659 RepID=A0ABT4VQ66_9HYPH|nr:MATE family efflux transporter [Hoeflea poritis]MDA4846821.1 MATE family efflux transporter [Hoeflea poritis]